MNRIDRTIAELTEIVDRVLAGRAEWYTEQARIGESYVAKTTGQSVQGKTGKAR